MAVSFPQHLSTTRQQARIAQPRVGRLSRWHIYVGVGCHDLVLCHGGYPPLLARRPDLDCGGKATGGGSPGRHPLIARFSPAVRRGTASSSTCALASGARHRPMRWPSHCSMLHLSDRQPPYSARIRVNVSIVVVFL